MGDEAVRTWWTLPEWLLLWARAGRGRAGQDSGYTPSSLKQWKVISGLVGFGGAAVFCVIACAFNSSATPKHFRTSLEVCLPEWPKQITKVDWRKLSLQLS